MLIDLIVGARPNFVKIAPIIRELKLDNRLKYRLVHTGQHYDQDMSNSFFDQLNIPLPDVNLGISGGNQSEQVGKIMIAYEALLEKEAAQLCLVVGDVNSTMACAITAKKFGLTVAHVEAGLRSGDNSMPEEINRIVTDSISDFYFTTSKIAGEILEKEGVDKSRIFFVGNTMIDTLIFERSNLLKPNFWDEKQLQKGQYFVLTLHRPKNVDDISTFKDYIDVICQNTDIPILFPVHPRTSKQLAGISYPNLFLVKPLSYLEFNYCVANAKGVITDSGGITEETTYLRIPCLTIRDNTERPETVDVGTNVLVGTDPKNIPPYLNKLNEGNWSAGEIPENWDGKAAKRIVKALLDLVLS